MAIIENGSVVRPMEKQEEKTTRVPRLTRRQWLTGGAGLLVTAGLSSYGYATLIEPHWLKIKHYDINVKGLPTSLSGKTMLQISDLHAGPVVDGNYLIRALKTAGGLKPDMIILTGDITQDSGIDHQDWIVEQLQHLGKPPLGIYTILGNHDYGGGWKNVAAADDLTKKLRSTGMIVLRNEMVELKGLQIIGMDDYWTPNFDPERALRNYDPTRPSITLCHNPDVCDLDVWGDHSGWIFAGHTHGGQCKPPFLPPPILPVKNRRYTQGLFDLGQERHLHINPGTGYLRRVRFNVRPELTLFTLQS